MPAGQEGQQRRYSVPEAEARVTFLEKKKMWNGLFIQKLCESCMYCVKKNNKMDMGQTTTHVMKQIIPGN